MKNLNIITDPDEIRHYIGNLWQTDLFKQQHEIAGSFIRKVVDDAAKYPIFFFNISDLPDVATPDNEKLEHAHFSSWWGGEALRNYETPGISDVYWLHELVHKGTMPAVPNLTAERWNQKMFDNELKASMASEIEIYLKHPEFREETFKQEIFVDRFLRDEATMRRYEAEPERVAREIRELRANAMLVRNPIDMVQYWIHMFQKQNASWAIAWEDHYNLVETKLHKLQSAIDLGTPRDEAMGEFMAWLQSPEISKGTEVPFHDVAKLFHASYMHNKKAYQEALDRGDLAPIGVRGFMKDHYPDQDIKEVFMGPLAKQALGDLPPTATRENYQISAYTATAPGSFGVLYAQDETNRSFANHNKGETVIILQRRKEVANGENQLGCYGGFTNPDFFEMEGVRDNTRGEQPTEGLVREIKEESVNDKGEPQLELTPDRFELIKNGIDYKNRDLPTFYSGYSAELSGKELESIRTHKIRFENDLAYREGALHENKGEAQGVEILTLEQAKALKKEQFTHTHEFDAVQVVVEKLQARSVEPLRIRG